MGARNRDAAVAASWQQHHRSLFAPRRSAGTAAAARSCGVAAATATMCAEHSRNDVRCRCVPRAALRLPICASRPRPWPDPRTAPRLPICKACLKGGTAWVVRSLDRQGTAPRVAKALNLRGVWSGLKGSKSFIYINPPPNKLPFYDTQQTF